MEQNTLIAILFTFGATGIVTWYLTRRAMSGHLATSSELAFQSQKNALIDSTRHGIADSPDFLARLNNEYLRGKEDGRKDELQKFSIVYEPFQDIAEEYMGLKKRAELGYFTQLYYSGLPIGEANRKTTHTNVEYDDKKIDKLVNSELMGSLNNMSQLILTKGIGSKVLPFRR